MNHNLFHDATPEERQELLRAMNRTVHRRHFQRGYFAGIATLLGIELVAKALGLL